MGGTVEKTGQEKSLASQMRDWIFDHAETGLAICIAITVLLGVIFTDASKGRVIPAASVGAFTVAQILLRNRSKERIDQLKTQITSWNDKEKEWIGERESYEEKLRELHAGNKRAIKEWITSVSKHCGLTPNHRLSLYVVAPEESCVYLLARYSQDPQLTQATMKEYTNDGAIYMAWKNQKHVGPLLPNIHNNGNRRADRKKKKAYVDAVTSNYPDVRRGRVERSRMSPVHYASWRLDVDEAPEPAVLVFESQIDSLEKVGIIEEQVLGEASKAMRQLVALAQEHEVHIRANVQIDIEGGAA